jgi:valyl-tRNA synthetase
VAKATAGFEAWDFTRALEVTEQWFWSFCDDYLELVKDRAYGAQGDAGAASARATLRISLDVVLRLFAPVLPYVTEEVWSWTHDGSVHRASWPTVDEVPGSGDPAVLGSVGAALAVVRKAKSEAKVGMRAEVPSMTLVGPDAVHAHVRSAEGDLRAAGKLTGILDYAEGDEVAARDIELVAVPKPTA